MSACSTLSIFPANHEQTALTRKKTHPQWGRGLTEEQYLSREDHLDKLDHAVNGKFTTWVLAPRDDPETLDIKCSCETYRRKGLIKLPGSSVPEEVFGYGIASVYTPPENRGKGYARHMMRLLHWVLAPRSILPPFPESWGIPPPPVAGCGNAQFSALYSDIGKDFYRIAGPDETSEGWIVRDPRGTTWDVPTDITTISFPESDLSAEWLDEGSCKAIWEKDTELIKDHMAKSGSKKVLFSFLSGDGVASFLVQRTIFFFSPQRYQLPLKWGVEVKTGEKTLAFATWTADVQPPPPTLIITRIRATKGSFPFLVTCLLQAARERGMERVEVWNLPNDLEDLAHHLGGKTDNRDEHLNAFKWYGPERNEDIEWLFNEK